MFNLSYWLSWSCVINITKKTSYLKSSWQSNASQNGVEEEGQADGENGATGRNDTVHQAQTTSKVMAQNDQRWIVGQRRTSAEKDSVSDVQGPHLRWTVANDFILEEKFHAVPLFSDNS